MAGIKGFCDSILVVWMMLVAWWKRMVPGAVKTFWLCEGYGLLWGRIMEAGGWLTLSGVA